MRSVLPLSRSFIVMAVLAGVLVLGPRPAVAAICTCSPLPWPCTKSLDISMWWGKQDFTKSQKNFLKNDFYQKKIIDELWKKKLYPALQNMTAQNTAVRTQLTAAQGKFQDAQDLIETQQEIAGRTADAYRDYAPSDALCRFGTGVGSLGAAMMAAKTTTTAMGDMGLARVLNKRGGGDKITEVGDDKLSRQLQYQSRYCNPSDNNGMMRELCDADAGGFKTQPKFYNRDIDPMSFFGKRTLDLAPGKDDFTDLYALSSHLYANDVLDKKSMSTMMATSTKAAGEGYQDLRSIAAFHGVAKYSFDTLMGMRAAGGGVSGNFLKNALKEMGLTDTEVQTYLSGDAKGGAGPSYDAQMEVLTKKLYQNQNFYTNLLDKPANIDRQIAAMKAFELIQNRDLYESMERQSMLISLMLELEVRKEQAQMGN